MRHRIGRRRFITILGGTAAAWPQAAWQAAGAQQRTMPVVGYLHSGTAVEGAPYVAAFGKGLGETGYKVGGNVAIELRFAENQSDRLPALAADLVRRRVSVIAALGASANAAKAATATIPIVFGSGGDPVEGGLVASLNRPGGNLTGVSFMIGELAPKRLELLHELLPQATRFAMLVNPNVPNSASIAPAVQAAAAAIGRQVEVFNASTDPEIDAAFARLVQKRAEGVLLGTSPLFSNNHVQLVMLAVRHALPAVYYDRIFTAAGGLMSYGPSLLDQYRQAGVYAGRILKGEKPADLPVMQPTKFELVLNLKTAKAIGLTIPPAFMVGADEVIE
jgi:putative ABC transport system substrate-binding protein